MRIRQALDGGSIMDEWIEETMNSAELMLEFAQKATEYLKEDDLHKSPKHKTRENAWVRKRMHKKKMYRKFLSANPSMNKDTWRTTEGLSNSIWVTDQSTNGGYYFINHFTHVFMDRNGSPVQYRGFMEKSRSGNVLGFTRKNKKKGSITNRRIRRLPVGEDDSMNYNYYKKRLFTDRDCAL